MHLAFPKTVFYSHGAPSEIEAKWLSNSELMIRYASGYPADSDYPELFMPQFKTVKITCEPVEGYSLLPKR